MNADSTHCLDPHQNTIRLPIYTHILAVACASIVAALAFGLPADYVNDRPILGPVTLPLPENPNPRSVIDSGGDYEWRMAEVKPGDSLSGIFSRLGLRKEDLYTLISASDEAKAMTKILPGQVFKIRADGAGELLELVHEVDDIRGLRIIRDDESFHISKYTHKIEKRTAYATGFIHNSFYESALESGLSDRLIMELVEIFGWDIDFALDIRSGDSFTVVFEEDFVAGEKIGNGVILAAEFVNNGTVYQAVRYQDPEGVVDYYTPDGRGMRQAFLRTPVDFRRISSHFQQARWHPTLGKKRPHRGVDYAAATGTPIQASGAGTVAFVGRKSGYGNTVILSHRERYTTLYAHMSKFAQGLKNGAQVEQGQIIGYVGQTGLATGPHLHYEFRVDGVHQNPVTMKLPGSPPVEKRFIKDFEKKTAHLAMRLDLHRRIAMNMQH